MMGRATKDPAIHLAKGALKGFNSYELFVFLADLIFFFNSTICP